MRKPETCTGKRFYRFGLIVLLTLVVNGITGCGYKTIPVPPEEIVPQGIADLRYELDERGVTLNWTYPSETIKGEELTAIETFKLFRAVVPADKYCDTCPIPFGEPVLLEGGAVVTEKPRTGEYKATLLRPGHLYFFKIRSAAGWWAESADSNIASFMWDVPPAAPLNLAASAADGKITLRWSSVTKYINGNDIKETVKYQVLKSSGGGAFAPIGQLQSDLEYIDTQVVNGKNYQYKIQAVTMYEKGQVSGGVSALAEAFPVDSTPPPVPAGIQGIRTAKGVKVVWERVDASDLKGYRVYRRLPDESKPIMVGEVNAPSTILDVTDLPESDHWYFSVTSIDKTKPANESNASAEVEVRN